MGLPVKINEGEDPSRLYENIEYKDYWSGTQKSLLDALERAIVNCMLPESGLRILDIGCGYGRLADCYIGRFSQAIMVDPSMSLLRQAYRNIGERASYLAADSNHLPFQSGVLDAVLMVRVFQHIPDSRQCLDELYRVMGNGGRLLFNFCNQANPQRIGKWLLGKEKEFPLSLKPTGVGTIFISHHPRYIRNLLSETGFTMMDCRGAGVFDKLPTAGVRRNGQPRSGLQFSRLLAKLNLAPWIFCASTVQGNVDLRQLGDIEDILQCPACRGKVEREENEYTCLGCHRHYPITPEEGIIDFRIS